MNANLPRVARRAAPMPSSTPPSGPTHQAGPALPSLAALAARTQRRAAPTVSDLLPALLGALTELHTRLELFTRLEKSERYPGVRRRHLQLALLELERRGWLRHSALFEPGPPIGLQLSAAGYLALAGQRNTPSLPRCCCADLQASVQEQLHHSTTPLPITALTHPPLGRPRAIRELHHVLSYLEARNLIAEVGLGKGPEYSPTAQGRRSYAAQRSVA